MYEMGGVKFMENRIREVINRAESGVTFSDSYNFPLFISSFIFSFENDKDKK